MFHTLVPCSPIESGNFPSRVKGEGTTMVIRKTCWFTCKINLNGSFLR